MRRRREPPKSSPKAIRRGPQRHTPIPGPNGLCTVPGCGRKVMVSGRRGYTHLTPTASLPGRCLKPAGEPGHPCSNCGRFLRMTSVGNLGHLAGRLPVARPGNAAWDRLIEKYGLDPEWGVPRGYCECGRRLATHPPLPKPKPLTSWHASRPVNWTLGALSRAGSSQEEHAA